MVKFIMNDIIKIKKVSKLCEELMGNWSTSLWGWEYEFYDKKVADSFAVADKVNFFLLVFKYLVDNGFIYVSPPNLTEPTKIIQNQKIWNASSDKMIEYIRSTLPKKLCDIDSGCIKADMENYAKFWYEDCPEILWIDKDTGKIYTE